MNINDTILEKLSEIEHSENVRIIHCVESGSRAWGFASPDSDYDVRFIYVRRPEFYMKLEKTSDVIEWQLDDVLDINGWDLQKALRLLHKSNPTLFEWSNSPIVYKTTSEWSEISDVFNKYFCSKSGLYHYLNTARSNYREYLRGEEVRLKKYFYVLRPILACKWILNKGTPPPMLFSELVKSELESEMQPIVRELIARKMNTPEIGTGKRIDKINEYIEKYFEEIPIQLEKITDSNISEWDELNGLFTDIVFR